MLTRSFVSFALSCLSNRWLHHYGRGLHRQAGFGLTEALGGMLILLLVWKGFAPQLSYVMATPQINSTARQMEAVRAAAQRYVEANYTSLIGSLSLNGDSLPVSLATLKSTGQLSSNIPNTNPYGQNYSLRIRYVTQGTGANQRNVLEPLLLTTGGQTIPDDELYRIASQVQDGGVVTSRDANNAIGSQGSWGPVALADFGNSPGAGHLAVGMFYSDAAGVGAEYLYRNAVPGMPEANQMNTAIDLNGNAIVRANTITATGKISTSADVEGRDLVAARDISAAGSARLGGTLTAIGNISANGEIIAAGRITTDEYLNLGGIATEGGTCSSNGLVGRTSPGLLLSCQSGVWRKNGGSGGFCPNSKMYLVLNNAGSYSITNNDDCAWQFFAYQNSNKKNYIDIFIDGIHVGRAGMENGYSVNGFVGGVILPGTTFEARLYQDIWPGQVYIQRP